MGSHAKYGEDGTEIVAERAIGRDDYGQPQFRKRSNMRQPRAYPVGGPVRGPLSLWQSLFGGGSQYNRRYRLTFILNPNWHELRKQEKCSSLAPPRSKFYKTQ